MSKYFISIERQNIIMENLLSKKGRKSKKIKDFGILNDCCKDWIFNEIENFNESQKDKIWNLMKTKEITLSFMDLIKVLTIVSFNSELIGVFYFK